MPRPPGINAANTAWSRQAAWVEDRYKLVQQGRETMLFDFDASKDEGQDVSAQAPKVRARMLAALRAWQASCKRSADGADYGK